MAQLVIEGALTGHGLRIGIVMARFNSLVTESLLAGALSGLHRHGVAADAVTVVKVPGSWELPLTLATMAQSGRYDGLIALGAVIRGDTPHFDYVAGEAAKGIGQAMMQSKIPIVFGVLTTNTLEQAMDRAGAKSGNKGYDAAATVIEMANLLRELKG